MTCFEVFCGLNTTKCHVHSHVCRHSVSQPFIRPLAFHDAFVQLLVSSCFGDVVAVAQSIYDSQPTTTIVPNRLRSVRDLLHEQLRAWLPKFCVAVTRCDDLGSGGSNLFASRSCGEARHDFIGNLYSSATR